MDYEETFGGDKYVYYIDCADGVTSTYRWLVYQN